MKENKMGGESSNYVTKERYVGLSKFVVIQHVKTPFIFCWPCIM